MGCDIFFLALPAADDILLTFTLVGAAFALPSFDDGDLAIVNEGWCVVKGVRRGLSVIEDDVTQHQHVVSCHALCLASFDFDFKGE